MKGAYSAALRINLDFTSTRPSIGDARLVGTSSLNVAERCSTTSVGHHSRRQLAPNLTPHFPNTTQYEAERERGYHRHQFKCHYHRPAPLGP